MSIDYRTTGINRVAIVLIPSICHQRLVVYSANTTNATGWAIRDFISNRMLADEHSQRHRATIEAEFNQTYAEYPPFYNVDDPGHAARWELYLILRTIVYHRRHSANYDTVAPIAALGDAWVAISPEPPWTPLVL